MLQKYQIETTGKEVEFEKNNNQKVVISAVTVNGKECINFRIWYWDRRTNAWQIDLKHGVCIEKMMYREFADPFIQDLLKD